MTNNALKEKYLVAFIITRADTMAGAQTHVLELSVALRNAGHKVIVYCGQGQPLLSRLNENNIEVRVLKRLSRKLSVTGDIRGVIEIFTELRKLHPDLVSLHSSKAGILGRAVCKLLKIPAIFTAHGWAFAEGVGKRKAKLYSTIERSLQNYCKKIICVSIADRELAISNGFNPSQLTVIHNGRHDAPYTDRMEHHSSPVRITMIGRLDDQKDHDTLLYALSGLENFTLKLVGDGPRHTELLSKTKALEIEEFIEFTGLVKDVSSILDQSDVFVLSSHWEGFPRSTLEAMRSGLPVIVSDVGGSAEAVIESKTGFVVPPGDVAALRTALNTLITDQGVRNSMGRAGRNHFVENFTFDKMIESTATVYAESLGIPLFPIAGTIQK